MCKKYININTLILVSLLVLTSCENDLKENFGRHGPLTPGPFFMKGIPQGDDDYSQGFRDGCNTGHGIIGTGMMSATYDDTYYDIDKSIENNDYYKGRTIGFNYCTYYNDVNPL